MRGFCELLLFAKFAISIILLGENVRGNDSCYDLPIVLLRTSSAYPTKKCHLTAPPPPGVDCMKQPFTTTIYILDGEKSNCISNFNTNAQEYKNAKIHFRGSSSLNFGKHQMSVNLSQPDQLVGLPHGTKWVLHGPWIDGSMLRNHIAHWLFRNTGRYSPRTKHVVLYMQENMDLEKPVDITAEKTEYKGLYLLMEKISFESNRLGLAENKPECTDFSGGWAWQYNPLSFGVYSPNLVMDQYQNMFGLGERPILEYPPGETLSQDMRNFFIAADTGPLPRYFRYLFDNMTDVEGLEQHINIGSFVDYILHTELSLNQDAYRRSVWFFKDRNQPINAGPVWDFNLAYGVGAKKGHGGWMMDNSVSWKRIQCNYKVAGLLIQRWKQLRQNVWSNGAIEHFIDTSSLPIQQALKKCSGDWKACAVVGGTNSGNYHQQLLGLKTSISNRAAWMDQHINDIYQKLNNSVCGSAGDIPAYNCAFDPDDDGCLVNPEKYYTDLPFPPIHVPYSGPPCTTTTVNSMNTDSLSTIDPCWLSAGTYMDAGSVTPFCSGFGACPTGPDAVCKCHNNASTSDCYLPVQFSHPKIYTRYYIIICLSIIVLVFVIMKCRRRHRSTLNADRKPDYGSLI